MGHEVRPLDRRQVLGAGVASAALIVLPEACSSSSETADGGLDASHDARKDVSPDVQKDASSDTTPEPDATLVDGGGACESEQTDWTRPINIMKAGIALKGTAYAFNDARFIDETQQGNRILVINPLTKDGYIAMSGVCTHRGCCPQYFSRCLYSTPESSDTPQCVAFTEPADAGPDASFDASADAPEPDGGYADGGAPQPLFDVLFCPCHQSLYDALNGKALAGPAVATGDLQLMKTCVGGGYVFVFIPQNPGGPVIPTSCSP
jgi:Rieske Fe-S protein